MGIDVKANRQAIKYSRADRMRRLVWGCVFPLFSWSPRPCFGWRRFILRMMGARIGSHVHIYASSKIYYPWMLTMGDDSAIGEDALVYNLGHITIGKRVTVSHRAHLCAGTHDYTDPTMPLIKPPINIGDDAWVCADAFIGPDIDIGEGVIVGARAAVFKDVPPWTIVGGNPAKFIKHRALVSAFDAKSTK